MQSYFQTLIIIEIHFELIHDVVCINNCAKRIADNIHQRFKQHKIYTTEGN